MTFYLGKTERSRWLQLEKWWVKCERNSRVNSHLKWSKQYDSVSFKDECVKLTWFLSVESLIFTVLWNTTFFIHSFCFWNHNHGRIQTGLKEKEKKNYMSLNVTACFFFFIWNDAPWQYAGQRSPSLSFCDRKHIDLNGKRNTFTLRPRLYKPMFSLAVEQQFTALDLIHLKSDQLAPPEPFSSEEERLQGSLSICWQDGRQSMGQQMVAMCTISLWQSLLVCWRHSSAEKLIRTPPFSWTDSTIALRAREPRKGLCHMQRRNILEY